VNAERIPASALAAGDFAVLPLPEGDEYCDIRRVTVPDVARASGDPGAASVVLVSFQVMGGGTGTARFLSTDVLTRVGHHASRAA